MEIFVNSPVWVYEIPVKEILLGKGEDWTIESVNPLDVNSRALRLPDFNSRTPIQIEIVAKYNGRKYEYDRVVFQLSSEANFGVTGFTLTYRAAPNGQKIVRKGKIEYNRDGTEQIRLKEVQFQQLVFNNVFDASPSRVNNVDLRFSTIANECDTSTFELESYGFSSKLLGEGTSVGSGLIYSLLGFFALMVLVWAINQRKTQR